MAVPTGHPAPEVACRNATDGELNRSARSLLRAAAAAGWTARATYARGTTVDRYSRPGKVVDSIVVRLARGDQRAVAVWEDGKWHTGYRWSRLGGGATRAGSRELARLVKTEAGDADA